MYGGASVTVSDILDAVRAHITANSAGLLPIAYENEEHRHNDDPYIRVMVSPDEPDPVMTTGDIVRGYIVGNVFVKEGDGLRFPTNEAQKFIDIFPKRGGEFGGGINVTSTGTPLGATPARNLEGWYFVPALIGYDAIDCFN